MHDKTDRQTPSPHVVAVGSLTISTRHFSRFMLAVDAAARAAGLVNAAPLAPALSVDDQDMRARRLAERFRLSKHHARTLAHLGFTPEPRNGER
jgi:hypothetical protein